MNRQLQLAHERIQDLEALVGGRPLPVRNRPSPLRWILVVVLAAVTGLFLPLQRTSRVQAPAGLPPRTLVLADNAPPVFVNADGRDLALFRGWWPGRESMPLYVVALDCADWSVRWISQGFPATAFDRGALRADDNGAAFLFTPTGANQHRQFVLGTDRGIELGSTDIPSRWEIDTAVREAPAAEHIQTDDGFVLRGGSLAHVVGSQVLYNVVVTGIPIGSRLGSITHHRNDLVIVANESIFVVDDYSGQLKKRIDSF